MKTALFIILVPVLLVGAFLFRSVIGYYRDTYDLDDAPFVIDYFMTRCEPPAELSILPRDRQLPTIRVLFDDLICVIELTTPSLFLAEELRSNLSDFAKSSEYSFRFNGKPNSDSYTVLLTQHYDQSSIETRDRVAQDVLQILRIVEFPEKNSFRTRISGNPSFEMLKEDLRTGIRD